MPEWSDVRWVRTPFRHGSAPAAWARFTARTILAWGDATFLLGKLDDRSYGARRAAALILGGAGYTEGRKTLEEVAAEIGDLLFAVANVARHARADAEGVLRGANAKFERRFHFIERKLSERGLTAGQSNLEDMDCLWNEAKRAGL